jgi:acyl carrier protein
MRESVIELLRNQINISDDIDENENLFFLGLNSILFMHFIVDLEMRFEIEVLDDELTLDNFNTVKKS